MKKGKAERAELKEMKEFIETKPNVQFVISEILRLENRLDLLDKLFEQMFPKTELLSKSETTKLRNQHNKTWEVSKLKKQLKYFRSIFTLLTLKQ